MKLFKYIPCLSGIGLVVLSLTFWMERNNPDQVELSFTFLRNGVDVSYWQFLLLVLIVYSLATLITISSYRIVFSDRGDEKLKNTLRFTRVVIYKYLIPFLLTLFTTINKESIFSGLEITSRLVLLLVGASLFIDWISFYFRYNKTDAITFRLGNWEIRVSVKTLYTSLSAAIWVIILAIILWRSTRKYTERSKAYSHFDEHVSWVYLPSPDNSTLLKLKHPPGWGLPDTFENFKDSINRGPDYLFPIFRINITRTAEAE